MMCGRRKHCGLSCQRLSFLVIATVLVLVNTWLWCKVFSLNCSVPTVPALAPFKESISSPATGGVNQLLPMLVEKVKTMFNNNSLVPEIYLSSLDVPTLSPSDKEGLKPMILKMSKLKKEYEIGEMTKKIEKIEHNLKRLNISVSLSKENNRKFEKKVAQCKTQSDELIKLVKSGRVDPNDSKIILKIQTLLDELSKVEERMKQYKILLEKQKELIIRKLAINYNLTFFENVLHS